MSITTYHDAAEYLGKKPDRPLPGRHTRLIRMELVQTITKYRRVKA